MPTSRDDGNLLAVDKLSAGYGSGMVLHDVSFAIPAGTVTALLGANGAGKTTLLRAISGMLPPKSGTIRFDGADITGRPPHTISRKGIAHVLQGRRIFGDLTVIENLQTALHAHRNTTLRQEKTEHALDMFPPLRQRRSIPAAALSGGEQQMLAIACALLTAPRLLMVDELSLGLAPKIADSLLSTLCSLSRSEGVTVLLVEQNTEKALAAADNALVMQLGRILVQGPPRSIDESVLVSSYLG